jgi:hypothetical protein
VRPTPAQRESAVALHAQGVAKGEIAERLDLMRGTVAALLRRRPTFAPRTCRLCGEPFVPTNGRQRFCTPAHRLEHQRTGPRIRPCRLCGEPFTPSNGRQRFCTPAHQREHQRRHGPPRTTAGWRERVDALEAEIARVRAQLDDREAA